MSDQIPYQWALPFFVGVFVLTLVVGARLIPLLQTLSFRQHAYEDAPQSHAVKTGTPTMGGVLFALALVVTLVLALCDHARIGGNYGSDRAVIAALVFLGLGCGLVGFVDDLIGIRGGRNRGLRARAKLGWVAVVGAIFLWLLWSLAGHDFAELSYIQVWPGHTLSLSPPIWFALALFTIVATTQAVNLTDGLDGLAAGSILPALAVMILVAVHLAWDIDVKGPKPFFLVESRGIFWVDLATAASVLGFLYYNRHPARLMMGDTGSLALGGILAGSAIMLGLELFLILIAGVFVVETLSVILQVASFKLTGKRIFRMSPLHHHFELAGWPETKVTFLFWGSSLLCALAFLITFRTSPS